jgi:hypothetical protein
MNPELKVHRRSGRWDFTEQELENMKNQQAERVESLSEWDRRVLDAAEVVKNLKAHQAAALDTIKKENVRIRNKWEDQDQDCYRLMNYDRGVKQYWAIKTRKLLSEVPMSSEDRQTTFLTGDMVRIENPADRDKYTDVIFIDGAWWSFGPRIPDQPKEEQPATEEGTATLMLTEGDIDHEKHLHFDPQSPSPVLFRNNLPIVDIIDAHEAPTDGLWATFTAEWELTQPEIDAVMQFHWRKTAEGTEANDVQPIDLQDYPTLKNWDGEVVLKRNGLKAQDVYNMSQKDAKIWNKYVKTHGLTEEEIENVGRFTTCLSDH